MPGEKNLKHLEQMSLDLGALHVFVDGGEDSGRLHGSTLLGFVHKMASLGATFMRSVEWKGYIVTSIPLCYCDSNLMDSKAKYSLLSYRTVQLTGQWGLVRLFLSNG